MADSELLHSRRPVPIRGCELKVASSKNRGGSERLAINQSINQSPSPPPPLGPSAELTVTYLLCTGVPASGPPAWPPLPTPLFRPIFPSAIRTRPGRSPPLDPCTSQLCCDSAADPHQHEPKKRTLNSSVTSKVRFDFWNFFASSGP